MSFAEDRVNRASRDQAESVWNICRRCDNRVLLGHVTVGFAGFNLHTTGTDSEQTSFSLGLLNDFHSLLNIILISEAVSSCKRTLFPLASGSSAFLDVYPKGSH